MILDGKVFAKKVRARLKEETSEFREKTGIQPGLATVLVGENSASAIYVRRKIKACEQVGFLSRSLPLSKEVSQEELIKTIQGLNVDSSIHGILVQLPLPDHLDEEKILAAVDPEKDVDGFHEVNVGRLSTGRPGFLSCTPRGIIELLKEYGVDFKGKRAVVVGRSNIVGKPLAYLLLREHATVTICHSRTKDLKEECQRADLLFAAIGKPEFIRGDWVKKGAVVVDVGMNRLEDGRLVGDVAFEEAQSNAELITPVPGGVGPMTIAMLLANTLDSARMRALK